MHCVNNGQITFLAAIVLSCRVLVTFVMAGGCSSSACRAIDSTIVPSRARSSSETNTGYTYKANDTNYNNDTTVINTGYGTPDITTFWSDPFQKHYLKCTYVVCSINHLSLAQVLLDSNADLPKTISIIAMYEDVSQKQMSTLYTLGMANSASLWIFDLYVKLLAIVSNRHRYAKSTLSKKNRSICEHLKNTLKDIKCPKSEMLEADPSIRAHNIEELLETAERRVSENMSLIDSIITSNTKNGLARDSYTSMFFGNLCLNDFGYNQIIDNIMKDYKLNIVWRNFSNFAENSYREVRLLHDEKFPLYYLINYQKMCLNFLKLMMIRFSEMYYRYVVVLSRLHNIIEANRFKDRWVKEVFTDFVNLLCLQEDKDVTFLKTGLKSLRVVDPDPESTTQDDFMANIRTIVKKLAMALDVVVGKFDIPQQLETTRIELRKTMANAKQFIDRLKQHFKSVDFGVIKVILPLYDRS
ncbi:uncharacterized protein LOC126846310 [Adelges cooleyi]|uniref:uncharacterized protein LOC126846310 n=1 Tax=Adelges cooleyi TaxID=133065 RepID=UPI00217F2F9D|nr:uncharacterized protein LOC126846310 [Adelges cooleyi]